jgi:hypothetical protein
MEVVRLYERAAGKRAKVTHLPLGVARVVSRLARPFHPGLSQALQAAVLADSTDQSFDARALAARLPFRLTRLEEWVGQAVA